MKTASFGRVFGSLQIFYLDTVCHHLVDIVCLCGIGFETNMVTRSDFYTMTEAAEALGVSQESVRRAIRDGKLESVKPFKERLIPKQAVEVLLTKPVAS